MDTKRIVIPGELLSSTPSKAGSGTYVSGGKVYASVCGFVSEKDKVSVLPFSGPYMPKKFDLVVGYVTVVTPSNWIFDIGCPYEGLLHVSEYPVRVPSEEMNQHFDVGDAVLLKVIDVNPEMKIELTYKGDPICKKLKTGRIYDIPISKVSRVIGRSGSMISMLKAKTCCDIFVGNNGRIWMNGASEDLQILTLALAKIERDAKLSGLTDLVSAFIDEQYALIGCDCPGSCGCGGSNIDAEEPPALVENESGTEAVLNGNNRPKRASPNALKAKKPAKNVGKAVKVKNGDENGDENGAAENEGASESKSETLAEPAGAAQAKPSRGPRSAPKRTARSQIEPEAPVDNESGESRPVRAKRPKTASLKKTPKPEANL
ncbi:hypothetical protein MsAg5_11760 [Methanosarcinaceae archaeon Ag5]|uniref:Exosome complex component Rrp4 n=1 Tax=Methanolapillus africanus TaxID=3028297 RepID=A0AAE4SE59_9EURY|nr:hypothetical protein [Methanosarcinaceae archaeon Ag5]